MLCAIVLYQAMVTDVENCALQWDQFGHSLSRALRYIESRSAYHQWRHEQKLAAIQRHQLSGSACATNEAAQKANDAEGNDGATEKPQAGLRSSKSYTGGEVRPGRGTVTMPNTSLARLKDELGEKKASFLDEMPQLPMRITPHDLGPSYFPFRMLIGSHRWSSGEPFKVYAYLEHDRGKGATMRFLSHDDTGHEQSFTVDQLLGISLLQPLEYLNNFKKTSYANGGGSSARTAKIRSVISYYFFLAENEGLIGDPRVTIGEAFAKRLCAAIKEMRGATFVDNNGGNGTGQLDSFYDSTNIDVASPKAMQPTAEGFDIETDLSWKELGGFEPSRIVKPRVQSNKLRISAKSETSHHREQHTASSIQSHRVSNGYDRSLAERHPPGARDTAGSPRTGISPSAVTTDRDLDRNFSDSGDIPMDISSLKSTRYTTTVRSPSRAPSIPITISRDNSVSHDPLTNSHDASIRVAQVVDNKPPTPEGSAERELKSRSDFTSAAQGSRQDPLIIDSGGVGEYITTPLHLSRAVYRQTVKAGKEVIDLTQSSPPSRGRKRGSSSVIYQLDSKDEAIEETDSNVHRLARSRRRK